VVVLAAVASVALGAAGCSLVTDLDGYEVDDGCSVDLELTDYSIHSDDDLFVRVVSEEGIARAQALMAPLGDGHVRVQLPDAVPPGPHRLEFYADVDGDGLIGDRDHTWRIEDLCEAGPVQFAHDFNFDQLDDARFPGADLVFQARGLEVTDRPLEVSVRAAESGRTVALARVPSVEASAVTLQVPGVIDPGFDYEVTCFVDRDESRNYDGPAVDQAFRWTVSGTRSMELSFDLSTEEPVDIEGELVTVVE
jgi:hypothetical protein